MKRRLLAFLTVTTLTMGFLAFGFFGSATSIAQSGFGRSFGASVDLVTGSGTTSLIAPLPSISVDKANPEAEKSLVRIVDQPPGPTSLIDEIAALYVTGRVDVTSEMAVATSDTARVALLETPDVQAALPGLDVNDLLGLVGTLGKLQAIPAVTSSPSIVADALHGIVTLSCPQLETLRTATTLQRLQAVTQGSLAQQVKIKPLNLDTTNTELPVVGNINKLNVDLGGTNGKERAAAYHLRVDLPAIEALGITAGTRLLEIAIYEVNSENLKAANFREVTVRTAVDMLHVTVLDKITGLPEVDVRVGHAEAALTGCGTPSVPTSVDVSVVKLVDKIAGIAPTSQTGLTAKPGDEVVYSLRIANTSSEACAITQAVDQLPTGFGYVSDSGALGTGSFNSGTNKITWSNLNIQPGGSATQAITVKLSPSIPSGIYVNRVTATGTCGTFNGSAPGIQVLGPITVDVVKTISSIAGVTLTPTSALTAKPGNEVVYKLAVTNSSDESCTISQVTDQLPPGFSLRSTAGELGAGTYDSVANTITWDGLEIASGETSEQGLVTLISSTIRPGTYRNRATATGSCGTFTGSSPAITISGVLGNIIRRGPTPRTGINDQLMWIIGPLFLAAAVAGVSVLRRSR
jgi:uncharacterized repeat protein (TIGR01451 family)